MSKARMFLYLIVMAVAMPGCRWCAEDVPAGHIGMTWEPEGFTDSVLGPGYHNCHGRCKMYLMEVTDVTFNHKMSVLCADSLNFGFDVKILVALNRGDKDRVKAAFRDLKPAKEAGAHRYITAEQLFNTYIRPVVDQESRKIISKYRTDEIVYNRKQIIEEVRTVIAQATKGTILKVKRVTVGNLDFLEVVTKAQELKAQRKVEIETTKAEALKQVEKEKAKLKVAEIRYKTELVEASMVADANKVIASSISPQYLAYKQLEVIRTAASGPNNWGFVPYQDVMNKPVDTSRWTSPEGLMDIELMERIKEAKRMASAEEKKEEPEAKEKEEEAVKKFASEKKAKEREKEKKDDKKPAKK